MITNLQTAAIITHKGPRVKDEAGTGWIDGPATETPERVAIRAAGSRDLQQAQALSVQVDTVVVFRAAATVQRGDVVTVNQNAYTVQAVPESGMPGRAVKAALCTINQAGR